MATILMIFPSVHYAFAEFREGARRFGPPLNTPLIFTARRYCIARNTLYDNFVRHATSRPSVTLVVDSTRLN